MCLAIGLDAFKKCVSLYWLIPFRHFPNTSQPGRSPESVLSEISRDWLITTLEGVGTAAPIRDVLGALLVPGAVLGAGLRQGPLPSLSASAVRGPFNSPPRQHIHEHIQKRRESLCTHHQHQQILTFCQTYFISFSQHTPPSDYFKGNPRHHPLTTSVCFSNGYGVCVFDGATHHCTGCF